MKYFLQTGLPRAGFYLSDLGMTPWSSQIVILKSLDYCSRNKLQVKETKVNGRVNVDSASCILFQNDTNELRTVTKDTVLSR